MRSNSPPELESWSPSSSGDGQPGLRDWNRWLKDFRVPHLGRSLRQIFDTAIPYGLVWTLMAMSLRWSYWATLALSPLAAALLVRLFVIQHDCGHGSFFRSRRACDVVGSLLGVLTLTPYHYWKREHAIHHATSGDLDRRGHGDIDTLTIDEYRVRSRMGRLRYRLYRHPIVLFLVGPLFHFAMKQRYPPVTKPRLRSATVSVWATNLGVAALIAAACLIVGWKTFVLVQLPVSWLASSMGVWLFYVQHQFEDTYWQKKPKWAYRDAALSGSSYFDPGRVLQWFTGNIGFHHIHHLNSAIPNYRLQDCYRKFPQLRRVTRITLFRSFSCARLTLWDEESKRLVSFREASRMAPVEH